MTQEELIELLKKEWQKPVRGMETFPKKSFEELVRGFGTTDLSLLPGNPQYQEIIRKGIILGYHEQRIYNGVEYGYHWGIDILSPEGTPIYAAEEGIVADFLSVKDLSPEYGGVTYGNYVVLAKEYFGKKILTLYGHLAHLENRFWRGKSIQKGELLGTMGKEFTLENGGWPPHLHFQIALSIEGLFAYAGEELKQLTINPEKVFNIK